MQLIDCKYDLCCIELHLLLAELVVVVEEYSVQFAALDERHHKVKSHFSLKEILHSTQKWMVQLEKDVFLKSDLVYDFLIDNLVLSN